MFANSSTRAGIPEKRPATAYLQPINRPKGVRLRLLYRILGRQFGKPPGWLTVWSSRMPFGYTSWMGKVYSLNKKLSLPQETMRLVRAQVDNLNMCTWCMDAGRWYVIENAPDQLAKLDAVAEYRTHPDFTAAERAALDFATELTERKQVSDQTFEDLLHHFSEREICELDWVVATNHLFNINNRGLGIGSDGLCELAKHRKGARKQDPLSAH